LLATIDRVLAWDESHPDVKVDAATREKLREGFKKFRADIVAKQDEIRAKRTKAGLPNVAQ
jgi:hypothetical protein